MNAKPCITIIVPIYSEERIIDEFYRRTKTALDALGPGYEHEFVFVDDGSRDRSLRLLKDLHARDPRARVISFSRNFGHQYAITAGLDYAKGDVVIIIDGDLQDPPELIPAMIAKWEEGYKVVYGVRKKRQGESSFKRLTAKLFYRALRALSEIRIPLDAGDFRLLDRKVVDALKTIREDNRYIRGLVSWVGYSQYGLEYERDPRFAGTTKYSLKRMIRFAVDGALSFSDRPLKITAYLGFVITSVSFLFALRIAIDKFRHPDTLVSGWTSLILTVLFIGGIQLISLGILGLYLGRQYREVKRRPLYVVADTYGYETDKGNKGASLPA